MNAQAVTERTLGGEKIPESWQQDRKLIRKFFCGQVIDVVEIETNHLKLITQPSGFPIRHHHFFCFDSFDQGTRALLYHETIDPHEEAEISAQPLDRLIEKIKYLAYLMNSKANYWPLVTIETSSNIGNEKEYFGHLINELEGYDIRNYTIEKIERHRIYISGEYTNGASQLRFLLAFSNETKVVAGLVFDEVAFGFDVAAEFVGTSPVFVELGLSPAVSQIDDFLWDGH